jgi:hypothetical protein
MAARYFDWLQLLALVCWSLLGMRRMLALYARGVRVLAPDRDRTPAEVSSDLLAGACLCVWWYELVAYTWPLRSHIIPTSLRVVLFDTVALKV